MTQAHQKNFSFPAVVEPRIRVISQRPSNFVSACWEEFCRCKNAWKELMTGVITLQSDTTTVLCILYMLFYLVIGSEREFGGPEKCMEGDNAITKSV